MSAGTLRCPCAGSEPLPWPFPFGAGPSHECGTRSIRPW